VRAVPNKYPLVGGALHGAHEVVVLSPRHDADLAALDSAAASEAMRMLRDRAAFHLDAGLVHVQTFVNHGRLAGASLEHPHAQLVALDFVPPAVAAQAARFADLGTDLVAGSLADAHRRGLVVDERAGAAAWCPWAAATPYETLVAHADAGAEFARAADAELDAVTALVAGVLRRLTRCTGPVPYNVVFHSAPGGHWYARVTARVFIHAGFEMGTGVLVNTVPGEDAAAQLRDPS
jgi:UDPglucose--hexose-1-phosphate uridylyltransferase